MRLVHPNSRREFYAHERPPEALLYARLPPQVAERFSNFSLTLTRSAAFDSFTAPLPAYFRGRFCLTFVPDWVLAEVIFAKVALARRSLPGGTNASTRVVFEGELHVNGEEPTSEIPEARMGDERQVPAPTERSRGD